MTVPVVCLLDYDNVRSIRPERDLGDVTINLEHLADSVAEHVASRLQAREVVIRLYGGWTDRQGRYTRQAEWVLAASQGIRGLRNRMRVLPEVVVSAAAIGGQRLKGLLRKNNGGLGQKMVDTVLCCDAIHFSRQAQIVVVSDDDDVMIGGLAASAEALRPVHLLRRRAPGVALNDDICVARGVKLYQF